jgi:hypothetical protein
MHTEASSLTNNALNYANGFTRTGTIIHEQLVKLIDDEKYSREGLLGRLAKGGKVLNSYLAEQFTAASEFSIHAFQDTEPEFLFALNGNDGGMG